MARVQLPASLRALASGRASLDVPGRTVGEVLAALSPPLRTALFLDSGELKRTVGVFLGEDDVREERARAVGDDDVIVIITAMAGG